MRIPLKLVAGIILVILAAAAAFQSPRVQTMAAEKFAQNFQKGKDADISFKMVSVRPFEAITLDDVLIIDRNPSVEGADTVAWIGSLTARFSLMGLIYGNGANLSQTRLENAMFQLVTEGDSTNLQRVFGLTSSEKNTDLTWGNLLSARDVSINNFRFIYRNPTANMPSGKLNFNNLDVTVKDLRARNLKMADSKILGKLDKLQAVENNSGYIIHQASARRVRVGQGRLRLEKLLLKDAYSDLNLQRLQLDGRLKNYSEFIDSIRISGEINPGSLLSMTSISYFGPGIDQLTFRGRLSGKVDGYVNDIMVKDISASDQDHNFSLKASGRIMHVTDIQNCALDFKVKEANFTLKGLEGFIRTWAPDVKIGLDQMARGVLFGFSGSARGPLNRLGVNGTLSSSLGLAKADITVRNTVDLNRPMIIDGQLGTRDLDVGKIAGIDAIGPVTLGTSLSATLPRGGGPQVQIDSIKIDRLNALGYDYSNISAAGSYAEDAFDGRIIAADPNLNFLFQGRFNLSSRTKNQVYRFYASLGYVDLHALNIDKRPQSKISFQAFSNFIRTESHDLLGDVNITDLTLGSASGTHNLGNISVKAHANDDVHRIKLDSQFLEGSYVGDKAVFAFVNDLKSLILDRELSALTENPAPQWDGATYKVNVKVKGAQALLDFLVPGSYMANPTELSLNVDSGGTVTGNLKSGRIALGEKFIKDLDLNLSNATDVLRADLESSSVQISSGVKLLGSRLALFANNNKVGLGYTFDNSEQEPTKAELFLSADLSRDQEGLAILGRALPSNLYYKGSGWAISSGDILFKGGDLNIDKLVARHDTELLEVNGGYSPSRADTLRVTMDKFDIGMVNTLTGNLIPLSGFASGNAVVISPGSPFPGIEAGIVCDSTMVSGQRMGSLYLSSYWNSQHNRFDMNVYNLMDGDRTIDVDGYFVPDGPSLYADADLDRLNLAIASPILSTVFSTLDGLLSGSIRVNGPLSNLKISSQDLKVADGHIALDFTRALYAFDGDLGLDQDALHFKGLNMRDDAGGNATITGDVLLNGFKDLGTAIHVDLHNIKALDLKKGQNSTLYGTLPVTGTVDVNGPLNRIVVDVNATTSGPGDLHLPIGSSSGERERNMLVFTEPAYELQQDPYELMMTTGVQQQTANSNLIINLTARATPDATVFIDLGENTLHAKGNGTIGLNMETAQNSFGLSGDYTLQEGSFRFSAMNLVSRDFTIQDGSSVRFNGPVNDTDLNVKGLYVTKASIANLVASTMEDNDGGSSRRVVNCGIDITGKLSNPEVDFSIDIPDLNPSTKVEVENAFSTKDKIQKQFIYLLIAGSFLPEEDSGISNTGSDVLFSNVSSIMSGQINNIFAKLDIPLDLGLNYKNREGQNMFDVAVSTQLFNNRVIVNGAVGNKQKIGSGTTNEVTGDIDVEVKLNSSGSLRTTVFSHSADQFSTYLDNSQRNGVGITFQREFYTLSQFFKEFFMTKKQREERAAKLMGRTMSQTVIQIDSTGKSKVIANDKR